MVARFFRHDIMTEPHDGSEPTKIERVLVEITISETNKPVRVATKEDMTHYSAEYQEFLDSEPDV